MKYSEYKYLIIGIISGILFGSMIIGIPMYHYYTNNYVQLNKVDIGYFIFKDNHIFQLEQLLDESQMTPDFKKATK
jgi:hypothetical protein